MAEIIDFQTIINQSKTDKANSANLNDEDMTEEEKKQEAVVNLVCYLTDTILEQPKDDEIQLTVRLADLAHLCEGYMDLLKKVGEIQNAAKALMIE